MTNSLFKFLFCILKGKYLFHRQLCSRSLGVNLTIVHVRLGFEFTAVISTVG